MRYNRRHFLQGAGGAAIGAASLGGLTTALTSFQARAADTSGYKAMVCLFLFGGLDCHDTVLPYDTASYNEYASIRAPLLDLYGAGGTSSRDLAQLLALTPDNAAAFGSRQFALPPQFSGIHGLFQSGDAAIVGNVGPLIFPINRTQFETESVETPKRLFSHNDQQSTWMSSEPEGASFGWGGRFADAAALGVTGPSRSFSTISTFSNELFLTGESIRPYQAGVFGPAGIETVGFYGGEPNVQAALEAHFGAVNFNNANFIKSDLATAIGESYVTNETFNAAIDSAASLTTPFPSDFLGAQLQTVAQSIAARDILAVSRQIYFVGFGGFDTHSAQAQDIPNLQSAIDASVVAFFNAMQELGVENDVTLFTASDFGRTLAINGDGTDHGWGAHHFVVGGAVQGRNIYGDLPEATFDHDQDAGGGRLIPTTAVEQFAEPLGRWFGLTDSEVNAALPNLSNFSPLPAPFV